MLFRPFVSEPPAAVILSCLGSDPDTLITEIREGIQALPKLYKIRPQAATGDAVADALALRK
jgi:hypothetical protein